MQSLGLVSLVVRDYDEALAFYVGKLGFTLIEDSFVPEQNKRWVVIEPPGAGGVGAKLLLARGVGPEQTSRIGNQTGGRVFLFLYTDDFWRDFNAFQAKGIEFAREPAKRPTAPSPCSRICTALYGTWCSCGPSSRRRTMDTTRAS
jgi:catechol 2,3-dioxygenase-like lactoylglutathione lyase family enzyme